MHELIQSDIISENFLSLPARACGSVPFPFREIYPTSNHYKGSHALNAVYTNDKILY